MPPPPRATLEPGQPHSTWLLVRWLWDSPPWGPLVVLSAHFALVWIALALFFPQSGGQDLYWYLTSGAQIAANGGSPAGLTEQLSWTAQGAEWINHEWLFTYGLHLIHEASGFAGLVAAKYVLLALWALALLWMGMRLAEDWYLGLLTALFTIPLLAPHTDLRPQLVTYALVTALLATWYRAPARPLPALLLWAVLFALWASLHAAVVFGVLLACALLLCLGIDRTLPWSHVGLGLMLFIAAPLANPYGTGIYEYALGWLQNPALKFAIAEWRPITDHGFTSVPERWWLLIAFVILAISLPGRAFERYRWDPQAILMLAVFAMPLLAIRHLPLAILAITAWWMQEPARVLPWLRQSPAREEESDSPTAPPPRIAPGLRIWGESAAFAAVLVAMPLSELLYPLHDWPRTTLAHLHEPYKFPQGALAFIETYDLEGNLFNYYDWGGYLGWRIARTKLPNRLFIDGRLDTVYPLPVILAYGNITSVQPTPLAQRSGWRKYIDQVDVALVPTLLGGQVPDFSVQWQALPEWAVVYQDPVATLRVRRSRVTEEFITQAQELHLAVPDDPQAHFARAEQVLSAIGDAEGARREYEAALALDPTYAIAHYRLATVLRVLGETAAAEEHYSLAERWGYYVVE